MRRLDIIRMGKYLLDCGVSHIVGIGVADSNSEQHQLLQVQE